MNCSVEKKVRQGEVVRVQAAADLEANENPELVRGLLLAFVEKGIREYKLATAGSEVVKGTPPKVVPPLRNNRT
jgi:hypothetical protein